MQARCDFAASFGSSATSTHSGRVVAEESSGFLTLCGNYSQRQNLVPLFDKSEIKYLKHKNFKFFTKIYVNT
jgi:hypothetical protein